MALVRHVATVRGLSLGERVSLKDGLLTIDAAALEAELQSRETRIAGLAVHIAQPGDATRILCTKDVIQPSVKLDRAPPGQGATRILEGVAVVTCGPIVGFQEGIIDMSGPGAEYSLFAGLSLVVLELAVAQGTDAHEHEAILRAAGLRAAEYLAASCAQIAPDRTEELHWDPSTADSDLPRIAYVDMVLSQGLLHDTYVLGRSAAEALPRIIDPRALVDGGLISGNCVSACDKHTTYHHQNNPLVERLLAGHGEQWSFVGAVVTNEPTRLAEKQRSARKAVELVASLGADGAVVTKEGFGNPDADLMMVVRQLQAAGVPCVAVTDEYAGPDGASQSLADTTPEADAIVSVGNANERIALPPMRNVIGPLPDVTRIAGGYAHSLRDDGSMEVELQAIVGATNQLGFGRLSCRAV